VCWRENLALSLLTKQQRESVPRNRCFFWAAAGRFLTRLMKQKRSPSRAPSPSRCGSGLRSRREQPVRITKFALTGDVVAGQSSQLGASCNGATTCPRLAPPAQGEQSCRRSRSLRPQRKPDGCQSPDSLHEPDRPSASASSGSIAAFSIAAASAVARNGWILSSLPSCMPCLEASSIDDVPE
jgi:hypothetical protein